MSPFARLAPSLLCASLLAALPPAEAQIERSAVSGTVTDVSGRVLPDVQIVATENATGLRRQCVSSPKGSFDLPAMPVGNYTLRMEHSGFAPLVFTNLVQTIGQTRTLNAAMKVASGAEQVRVTEQATDINQTSDALGATIEPKQVEQLPLNGRNWSTLTALAPGAIDTGGSNQRTVRFAGRGLDDNNFTYDGIDATNIVNQAQQPFVRLAIPTYSIQEFRVDTMLFTAEDGSTPGGQVAVVSRSGSNTFHGNLFEFLRNDVLDAQEPIDHLNPTKPPFHLNQYGGSLGGPIVRNSTFFFFTYEGLRQSLGQTLPGLVPSPALRAQVLAASPALAPILDAYPLGSSIASGSNGLASNFVGEGKQIDHEDSAMVRLDHRFSPRDSADLRFNFDAALSTAPLAGGSTYTLDQQEITSRPVNGLLEYLHIFSDTWVNETKFGFNRGNVYTTNRSSLGLPYAVSIPGLTTLNNDEYKVGVGNSYSYIDDLTWVHGQHTLKFGAEVRRIQLNQGNTENGTIAFASDTAFIADSVSSATLAEQLPVNGLRKTQVYAFAQDEWKVTPDLTLNLGLRYSFFNIFHEVLGRAIPFDFITCGPVGFCGAGASFGQPNLLDFDPRLAVAWSPSPLNGKTVLRAGFGIYHGDGQEDDQNLPISNEVGRFSLQQASLPNLSFPITPLFLATTHGIVSPRDDYRDRKDSYVSQWGTSVQQELGKNWVSTLSYVGSQGTYLLRTSYTNLIDPATGTRAYPGFAQVETRGNHNSSSYDAFVATLRRTFTHGLLFQGNYLYAHEIDQDAAGGGDSDFPQNPDCFPCERASGDFDARHVFSGDVVYDLPYGRGQQWGNSSGFLPAIFGKWETSTVVSARTGLPVNVTIDRSSSSVATGYTTNQRPNRVPDVPLIPAGGSAIHGWINTAAFAPVTGGGYGDAGRNLVRAPGLWQADLGVARHIRVTEAVMLEFRGEFFNVFNRAQYGAPLADFSANDTFGVIENPVNTSPVGTGTPRQVQFKLGLTF